MKKILFLSFVTFSIHSILYSSENPSSSAQQLVIVNAQELEAMQKQLEALQRHQTELMDYLEKEENAERAKNASSLWGKFKAFLSSYTTPDMGKEEGCEGTIAANVDFDGFAHITDEEVEAAKTETANTGISPK